MPSTTIAPIHYNSQCISFPEWVSLFTLCLAPLIAHIASGTPPVSYLSHRRPRWYDRLCHYNPTSIIWRYAAITDRRIRARRWSREDLAASSAIFWTANGWDGGEHMTDVAASYCLQYPESTHVQLLSVTLLKTLITTVQGLSAVYTLVGVSVGLKDLDFTDYMGLDMVFFPLALLGLLRLCAAAWLTEDFAYAPQNDRIISELRHFDKGENEHGLDPFLINPLESDRHFSNPGSSWPSRGFRAFYLLAVGGVSALVVVFMIPGIRYPELEFTATSFLVGLYYLVFTTVSTILYAVYFFRGQTTSTLLPCISKTWYKIYTFAMFTFMFIMVVIASVETNRAPDGTYTNHQLEPALQCNYLREWYTLSANFHPFFAIASKMGHNDSSTALTTMSGQNTSSAQGYLLYNFTGFCVGQSTYKQDGEGQIVQPVPFDW